MRIAYLSSSIIPSQKANSIQVVKMCNAFSQLGHEVTLFAKTSGSHNNSDSVDLKEYYGINFPFKIHRLSASNIRLLGGLEYAYKVYNKIINLNFNPDILYGRNLYALTLCQKLNRPIIYESHAAPVFGRKLLERYLFSLPQFKKLVVINKALYDYYINNFSLFKNNPNKILLAPDGSDSTEVITNKKIINLNNNLPRIGYAGSLYPGKGVDTIIELARIMPECNFVIAGGSDNEIKHFKETNNLNNLFFYGFVTPSDIPVFLSECDILLAPYSEKVYSEYNKKVNLADWMSPLKLFDYMSSKKPIIASNLPAIREILEDSKTAVLVDYNDITAWKNSIVKILCKSDFAKALSENAYELLKNKYTWKTRAERVLSLIDSKNLSKYKVKKFKKPVIVHIIGDLNVGGTERNLLKILSKMNNKHFEHRVITLFEPGKLTDYFIKAGIKVDCVKISKSLFSLNRTKAIFELLKLIKFINPVVIQTWLYHSNNLINLLSPFINKPIINSIRHDDPNAGSIKTKISAKAGAYISKIFNFPIVYCSVNSLKNHTNIGYSKDKTLIISNGFRIPEIDKKESKKHLKEKYNIPDNYKIAVNVGRYCPEKDYPTLFHTIKLVIDKYPQIVFVLCGKGLERNNPKLSELAYFSDIKTHLILLGSQSNIENIMAGTDFYVSSSSSEAFPNVIAESMSVRTPCIAANVGETSKIIGDTGIVVEPKNPIALANAVLKFINCGDAKLSILGLKAQKRIRKYFSLEKCISQFENLYSKYHYILTENSHNDNLKQ